MELSSQIDVAVRDEGANFFDGKDEFIEAENVAEEFKSLFKVQKANEWLSDAKTRPVPKKLFGEFWFDGEIAILFADTNVGKSILAVQIGDAISSGYSIDAEILLESSAQKVVYFDFELSDKQFEARYSEKIGNSEYFSNHYEFNENFIRAEINPNADISHAGTFEDYLNSSLKYTIAETGAKVLIIDNLTYLKNETEKAKDALPLMKYLKELKSRFGLSILALAHTPKRDMSKPITRNDLQGSKMLINFCDSSFAIGESAKDKGLRYLKQIKVRNAEIKFDSDNVFLCQIQKPTNFLSFEFTGYGNEREHLRDLSETDRVAQIEKIKALSSESKSQREIARELGISAMTVNRCLKKLEAEKA